MNTDISSYQANIIKRPFLRLARKKSTVIPGTFELDTASWCKLVDGLSNGKFIQYSGCSYRDGDIYVDPKISFKCMSYCLAERMDDASVKKLFGENAVLSTPEDYEGYIMQCSLVQDEDCTEIIRRFIRSKYNIDPFGEYVFTRKPDVLYKNY